MKKAAKQIKETLERQLNQMKFSKDEPLDPIVVKKMGQAPLTNLGYEQEFAHGDNDLKKSGGSTTLTTISNKHIVKQNALYKKEKWKNLTDEEKREKWRWASGSTQAKMVKQLESEFKEKLKALKKVAYDEKVEKKKAIYE